MNSQTTKKVTLALGVASVAASVGNVAVKAGPALQTLNNLTNTAEFSINNTYGQSFSVDGIMTAAVLLRPFALATAVAGTAALGSFNAVSATLTTNFVGEGMGDALVPVASVGAEATIATANSAIMILNGVTAAAGLGSIQLKGNTGTQTIGASISSTLFGASTVKATSSFTNQLINDLSAF